MAYIEIISVLFGLTCVVLTIRENIWCWPTGLVQVSLAVVVYYNARLYSDMWLHVIYIIMCIYGWYYWVRGGSDKGALPVTTLGPRGLAFWIALAVLGTIGVGAFMSHYTRADLPYWDAATTVLSLIAQWLMAKKKLESFMAWILVDVLCIGIYFYKGLFAFAFEYAAFLVLAASGLIAWHKSYLKTSGRMDGAAEEDRHGPGKIPAANAGTSIPG